MNYFGISHTYRVVLELDQWIRRRVRLCFWKTWKRPGTKSSTGGVGQLFLTSSLRFAPVSTVVPFDYMQLLWAVLLGWAIWDTHPPGSTWLGATVIIASGLFTLYREHKLGREKPHRPQLQP